MTDFPAALGLAPDEVGAVLTAAGRAPSLHNSQPWLFRVQPDVIELHADPRRRLPAADTTGREQRLACGAALYNLRLALLGHGIRPLVTLVTDPDRTGLLATVRNGGHKQPSPEQLRLLHAIPRRHTNRQPFTDEPVSTAEMTALRRAASDEGAWMHVVEDPAQREALRELAVEADAAQQADPSFRAEFARWTATEPGRSDGVPARANEHRPSPHDRWVVRDFTGGNGRTSAETGRGYEHEPTIAILSAHLFGTAAEVAVGQAMQRVLLTAAVEGLATSFLSQVVEVDATRRTLQRLILGLKAPQVVLRIGRGFPVPATPRRSALDLVVTDVSTTV